jgi:5-methylcytosine-specific restriction endonuclease McrA
MTATVGTITYYEATEGFEFPIPPKERNATCRKRKCTLLGRIKDDGSVHVDHVTPDVGSDRWVFASEFVDPETHLIEPSVLNGWLKDGHRDSKSGPNEWAS